MEDYIHSLYDMVDYMHMETASGMKCESVR